MCSLNQLHSSHSPSHRCWELPEPTPSDHGPVRMDPMDFSRQFPWLWRDLFIKVLQESIITSSEHPRLCALPLSSHTLNTFSPSYLSDFDSENTELFLIAPAKWMLYQLCASRGQSMGLDVPDWAAPHISPPGMQQKLLLSPARLWGSRAAEYWMWR